MFTSVTTAKAAAKRLQQAFSLAGRPQQLVRCQAILAGACGFNEWQHLSAALGTVNEPASARSENDVRARFDKQALALFADPDVAPLDRLFHSAFHHGTGGGGCGSAEIDRRISRAVHSLPPSELFVTPFREGGWQKDPGNVVSTAGLPGHPDLEVDMLLEKWPVSDGEHLDLRVREALVRLRRGTEVVGEIRTTLFIPLVTRISVRKACIEADFYSAFDLWTAANLGRDIGPRAFHSPVAVVLGWEMATAYRGRGIGTEFLRAALADWKSRHRSLATVAINHASSGRTPNFGSMGREGPMVATHALERLRRHIQATDLKGCLGKAGRLVLFDNSRQGDHDGTDRTLGALLVEGTLPDDLEAAGEQFRIGRAIGSDPSHRSGDPEVNEILDFFHGRLKCQGADEGG